MFARNGITMHEYDLIAPYYDIEHQQFNEDLDMYRDFAALSTGPLLELACGSGRLLIPLALDGYTITGVDGSGKMLSLARERVQQANLTSRITLVQQDMTALQLSQKFSFAFVASDHLRISPRAKPSNKRSSPSVNISPLAAR